MFKSDAAIWGCYFKNVAATIMSLNKPGMASKTSLENSEWEAEDEEIARILRWAATA